MAKGKGLWIPMDNIFKIGVPGPSGNENDTYTSDDKIYKVNNLLNTGSTCKLFEKLLLHNAIFPETAYSFFGFAGYDGRSVMPVFMQDLVKDSTPATTIEIETYMAAIGFRREQEIGRYTNGTYTVWDLVPRNVLRDRDGDIFVVDAEIKRN